MDPTRRCDIEKMTTAELQIRLAIVAVESLGAHTLLTDAVVLLSQAQGKVADFIELPSAKSETT